MDQGEFSALIGRTYDAALDTTLWTEVLTGIAEFVGGHAAALLSKNNKHGNVYFQAGVEPEYMRRYSEIYSYFDPQSTLAFFDAEQIVSTADLVPYDELQAGRFYRECAEPRGFVDAANVVLEKSGTRCVYLSVIRNKNQGMTDDAMRRRLKLIVPHLRRAIFIGKVFDRRQAETATLADVTDGLGAGVFLVDASARIVHANAAGCALLREGAFLRTVNGRLVVADEALDQSLREIFAAAGNGDDAGKGIAVPLLAPDGERYVGYVLSLTAGKHRRAGARYGAVAAFFVRRVALDTSSPREVISKIYKLTPTELRVLLEIIDVGGVPKVAAKLGLAEGTVKMHLAHVFGKTGTARQADLVKLVAGYVSPLSG
jgi:DNA-binding CsgD family transcriptional regulator